MDMARLLSKQKEMWARAHKPKQLIGKSLNPNISAAKRYQDKLDALIKKMTSETESELRALFKTDAAKEFFAQDASLSSQARILTNALSKKFNDLFASVSKPIAEKVVDEAEKNSSAALKASLKQLSGGLVIKTSSITPDLKEVLNASTTENVALIKSISEKYLSGVQQAVMRSITGNGGLQELIPYLQKSKEITYRRAKMIAYDQTRKAYNSINIAKMDDLGIKKFKWLHSGGSNEPRKYHISLSGKIFSIDDLPLSEDNQRRIFPSSEVNCRCRMLPVISFEEK
jgi:SPP1 gp7 family putative phage head morphogenesis protein